MKILLVGATGQLGADLIRNNPGHDIVAPDRRELDLANPDQIRSVIRVQRPNIVINCAAFHNVPLCEDEPEQALRINCVAVRELASCSREVDARLVTFSTDYVFDGRRREPYRETDCPAPIQMYGISRLAGELAAMATAPERCLIVRTCGLYGRSGAAQKGGNFVDKRMDDARRTPTLEMGSDQTVSPTSTEDLSRAVYSLLEIPGAGQGIYHLVNEGECTWYEFTRAIYEISGASTEVIPVDRKGLTGSMRRPLYSVLANTRAAALGIRLPHWREALEC
ncbi:dTDP-4-dehydrorhamnose reductase, partial [Methylocaldum sp.]|uniref:dTDP-4-dehydrorhamnose reductase n=1 Tax=Methylocaldum sp. TaxID=1969727 RepID=UPI00321FF29A